MQRPFNRQHAHGSCSHRPNEVRSPDLLFDLALKVPYMGL